MSEFTFLEERQIFGRKRLDILKKNGTKCAITDFSILLGGYVSHHHVNGDISMRGRTGWWWTKTPCDFDKCVFVVDEEGDIDGAIDGEYDVDERAVGARPAIPYSSISGVSSNGVRRENGILEVEYGEYPQTVVPLEFSFDLERAYLNGTINQTGKSYTTDSVSFYCESSPFRAQVHEEYEYNGKKYIRFVGDSNCIGHKLSDGSTILDGNVFWVEVEPIKWMIDEKTNIALSKKILFSGVQFKREEEYIGDFNRTDIKEFMDRHFSKDITPSFSREITPEEKSQNEEILIDGALDYNIPVFLHGQASELKRAILKQADSNYEIIYMRNASLESFIGKENVPPTWYKNLVEKCTNEPDKIHIVLFDELTNANPSVQKAANDIVLTRKVNGIWSLPENARIVASENEIEETYATNPPIDSDLYNYLNVYIKTTYRHWLEWANDNNIHPIICAYIAYKKEDLLLNGYNGKVPKVEPQKWELASKMLYKTNNPASLRAILKEEFYQEFIEFYNTKAITLEEFDRNVFILLQKKRKGLSQIEKYLTAMNFSQIDESYYKTMRELVLITLGKGPCELFDALFSRYNKEKLAIKEVEHQEDVPEGRAR